MTAGTPASPNPKCPAEITRISVVFDQNHQDTWYLHLVVEVHKQTDIELLGSFQQPAHPNPVIALLFAQINFSSSL
jgi:hypothetical protein